MNKKLIETYLPPAIVLVAFFIFAASLARGQSGAITTPEAHSYWLDAHLAPQTVAAGGHVSGTNDTVFYTGTSGGTVYLPPAASGSIGFTLTVQDAGGAISGTSRLLISDTNAGDAIAGGTSLGTAHEAAQYEITSGTSWSRVGLGVGGGGTGLTALAAGVGGTNGALADGTFPASVASGSSAVSGSSVVSGSAATAGSALTSSTATALGGGLVATATSVYETLPIQPGAGGYVGYPITGIGNSVSGLNFIGSSGFYTLSGTPSTSGSAAVSGSAIYAGVAFPAGQAGEFVATWGNDAKALAHNARASGTDALSAINAVSYPFATGTAALSVAQPYDQMLFSTGTFAGFNYSVPGLWIKGAGPGSYTSGYTGFTGGTVFTGTNLFAQTSGTAPVDGLRWSDFASTVSVGTQITSGTTPNQFTNVWMSNLKLAGPGGSNASELIDLYSVSGGLVENCWACAGGQAFVLKGDHIVVRNFHGINDYTNAIVIKNPGYNNGGSGNAYWAANDVIDAPIISSTTTNTNYAGIYEQDFNANNNPPMSNILVENGLFSTLGGSGAGGVLIQLSGTYAVDRGLQISNCVSMGSCLLAYNTGSLPVYPKITGCNTEDSPVGFYGVQPAIYDNCTAENCATGIFLQINNTDVFADFPGCTVENCQHVFETVNANTTYTLMHAPIVTGTYGNYLYQNSSGANLSIMPTLYQWWRNNAAVTVTSETSLLTGFSGYGYGSTTVPLPIMQQHPIGAEAVGYVVANGTTSFTFKWKDAGLTRASVTITPAAGTFRFAVSAQTAIRYSLNILDGDLSVSLGNSAPQDAVFTTVTTPGSDEAYDLTITASDANSTVSDSRSSLTALQGYPVTN